jgi:hypothetical protein
LKIAYFPNPLSGKDQQRINGRKRTVQIKLRVTEEERNMIEEKMKQIPIRSVAAPLNSQPPGALGKFSLLSLTLTISHQEMQSTWEHSP